MLHNARARVLDTPMAKKQGVFDMTPDEDDDDFEPEDFLIDASDMVTHHSLIHSFVLLLSHIYCMAIGFTREYQFG